MVASIFPRKIHECVFFVSRHVIVCLWHCLSMGCCFCCRFSRPLKSLQTHKHMQSHTWNWVWWGREWWVDERKRKRHATTHTHKKRSSTQQTWTAMAKIKCKYDTNRTTNLNLFYTLKLNCHPKNGQALNERRIKTAATNHRPESTGKTEKRQNLKKGYPKSSQTKFFFLSTRSPFKWFIIKFSTFVFFSNGRAVRASASPIVPIR